MIFGRIFEGSLKPYFKGALFVSAEDDERECITPVVTGNEFRKRIVEVNFGPID